MVAGKFVFPPFPTNIFQAVLRNDEPSVKFFVEEMNVSVTTVNLMGQTTAHAAAFHGYFNILKYLLGKDGSLVAAEDRHNQTALHMAVENGMLDSVRYLVDEYNADIYKRVCDLYFGNTVLHIAAEEGHLEVLKYLIEDKRMDTNLRNSKGQPPAFLAANFDRFDVIQYLAENTNANFTMTDNRDRSILHMLAAYTNLSARIPKYLLDERRLPLDVNRKDFEGRTTVSLACNIGNVNLIEYLVGEKGADVNICDEVGRTPIHQASSMNRLELVRYLVEHGADPVAKDREGRRPIELTKKPEVADYLQVETWKRIPEDKPIFTRKPEPSESDYGTSVTTRKFYKYRDAFDDEHNDIVDTHSWGRNQEYADKFAYGAHSRTYDRKSNREHADNSAYGARSRTYDRESNREQQREHDGSFRKPFRDSRDYESSSRRSFRDSRRNYEGNSRRPFRNSRDHESNSRRPFRDSHRDYDSTSRRPFRDSRDYESSSRRPFRDSRDDESNSRKRRSLAESLQPDSLAKYLSKTPFYSHNNSINANIREPCSLVASHKVGSGGIDIRYSHVNSIFWLANAGMRFSKHSPEISLTPKEMLESRLDVIIALDAVNSTAYE